MSQDASKASLQRRAYTGSCHCGTIKYLTYLSLPMTTTATSLSGPDFHAASGLGLYKCNCTVCHKMGIFHLRLASAPNDFVLLSPLDLSDLTGYKCNAGKSDWYFCKTCGVRCFTVRGEGEVVETDVPMEAAERWGECEDGKRKVWRLRKEGWREGKGGSSYFSVNAVTLDPGQEGLDLRALHENGWIAYVDSLDRKEKMGIGRPHRGGMY